MQEIKNIAYPAIFERDEKEPKYYNVFFPDFGHGTYGLGFQNAVFMAQDLLLLLLQSKEIKTVKPSTREEIIEKYPNKKVYLVTPAIQKPSRLKTSPSTHYLVLKIVKSSENNFNVSEVKEVIDPFDKIVLYLTLLKHCDLAEGYDTYSPPIFLNEEPYISHAKNCLECFNAGKCHTKDMDELRELLYSLKELLIQEYASTYNLDKDKQLDFINEILSHQDCFSCCSMFDMGHTKDVEDCMCGFYSYKTIKKQLDELNCFDNVNVFVKKFLSPEYKFVALKLEYGEDENEWDYINE